MESWDTATLVWVVAGAFVIGLAKGGVLGVSNITVAIFAMIFPPKLSVGIILLLLVVGDWGAFYFYRRYAVWKYLLPTIPWTIGGVVLGWQLLDKLDGEQVGRLIGLCLLVLMGIH
ncbi:MAG: sulfite exporter TauE/SafE family protein, partial [Verrucomicrobia bacterium]|nr:sulfite exporter TauE/SafE family protein [Verrucomicrobiota bacterium]